MALVTKDGKEIRVVGGAIEKVERRKGALGLLDGKSFREFESDESAVGFLRRERRGA